MYCKGHQHIANLLHLNKTIIFLVHESYGVVKG